MAGGAGHLSANCPTFSSTVTAMRPGTELGSSGATRSFSMGALESSPATPDLFTPRRRDRRSALGDLLIAVTRTLRHREDLANVRGAFEAAMQRLTPVRTAT